MPTILVIGLVIGCQSDDARIAEMAQRQADREAEHIRQMAQLQQQVAEGSRHLVEADAETRKELTELQRDLRSDQATVGQQRDSLEAERRQIAADRRWDSVVGPAITGAAILIACVLPLVVCVMLLRVCMFRAVQRSPVGDPRRRIGHRTAADPALGHRRRQLD